MKDIEIEINPTEEVAHLVVLKKKSAKMYNLKERLEKYEEVVITIRKGGGG